MIRGDREYRREKLGIGRPSQYGASQYGASQYCTPASTKKWTPGIYHEVSAMGSSRAGEWNAVKNRLSDRDDGVMFRFSWPELERDALGSYDAGFNLVQDYLDQCAERDKQFMLFLQFKSFGGDAVPKYMKNNTKYSDGKNYSGCQNGQFAYESSNGGTGGYVPNQHVSAVRERFEALMTAYAERFDTHPNFECLVFSEASIDKPRGAPEPWADLQKWYTEMARGLIYAKERWENTQICQWVNSPRKEMEWWVPDLLDGGLGLGLTDVCELDKSFNYRSDVPNSQPRGNFEWAQICAGKAIVMAHFSKPTYQGTVVGRSQSEGTIQSEPKVYPTYPGPAKTREQNHLFAVNKLKASHCVYIHNGGNQPEAGDRDQNAPASAQSFKVTSDEYSGSYSGKKYNAITDAFIQESESTGTVTDRPDFW